MTTTDLIVYYNSACPVCDAGIRSQRTTMAKRDIRGAVEWVDIACNAQVLNPLGLQVDQVRHSLHAVRGGEILVGADALIALAALTPHQRWMARLFGKPVLLPITRFAYDRFADILYWWNKKRGRW